MAFQTAVYLFLATCFLFDLTIAQGSYAQVALDIHNRYREKHKVGPLTLTDQLNNAAVQCAEYYAGRGGIDHSCPHKEGAGENLYMTSSTDAPEVDVASGACEAFYSEEPLHDYSGDWQPASGHFTQMVWKASTEFGFGVARGGSGTVGVALYLPHGNMMGDFTNNVFDDN